MVNEIDELAAALVAFQASVPTINKGRTALIPTKSGGSYSYKYADLTDIWETIRPTLAANGLAVTQPLTSGGDRIGINTIVWHKSGQRTADAALEFAVTGRTPQEIGSQITYFKRYALSAALGLSTEEDDDGAAASRPVEPKAKPKTAADKARDDLAALVKKHKMDIGKIAKRFTDDYGLDIREADVQTIQAFLTVIADEARGPQ